jgi:peptidyl-prolyl cis-trans isomerase D
MPIMTRMRDSMPIILFGLLIAFLITIIFEWGMDYLGLRSGRQDTIGTIDGRKVSYQEFSELVKGMSDQQKTRTGAEPDENELKQIREQAWQALVTQQLVEREIGRLGITVTDQELVNWVRGENPPDDLRRYFVDSTGQFRRDAYEQFLNDPNQFIRDPQGSDQSYGTKWLANYEKSLRQRRMQEKLQSVLTASIRVGEGELRQRFEDQTQKINAAYALFDPNTLVKDGDVSVTDADLKSYYEENIDQYKFDASRKLKYVLFLEAPSAADSAMRLRDIEDAASKARKGSDFLQLVSTYSDKPDSGVFFRHGELTPALEEPVFSAKVGDIIGPVQDSEGYRLVKVLDQKNGDKPFIKARHILFAIEGQQDTVALKALAVSVAKSAREGKDFSALAQQYSKDASSAQRGGDLGWFGKGRMVAPFEEAAFKAKAGDIVGPVRTPFGYHVIRIDARDMREVKLATISVKITPSSQTKNDLFDRSRDFAFNARESEFSKEAQQLGFEVREAQVQEKGGVVPGVGINESITRWAFSNKVGSVSEPYSITNGYAVFAIAESKDAGVKPFEEAKESVRPLAIRKKRIEKTQELASELRSKLGQGDSLSKVVQLDPSISVRETGMFSPGTSVPGIGRDPNFVGTVTGLKSGEISKAIAGTRGAYLVQLLSKSDFDSTAYAGQREALRSRLLQEKRSRYIGDWIEKLKANADIEDHRDLFFR